MAPRTGRRQHRRRDLLLVVTLCSLVAALVAAQAVLGHHFTVSTSATQTAAVPGEEVTFTATGSGGTPPYQYTFWVEEDAFPTGSENSFTRTFTEPLPQGSVYVWVEDSTFDSHLVSEPFDFEVVPHLDGSIARSPQSPAVGQTVSFTATSTGGKPPHSFTWDLDGDGSLETAGRTVTTSYGASGQRTVRLRITDAASPAHTKDVTGSFTVQPQLTAALGHEPPNPEAGDTVRVTTTLTNGTAPFSYAYTVRGVPAGTFSSTARTHSLDVTLPSAGISNVAVSAGDANGQLVSATRAIQVDERLTPRFSVSPTGAASGAPITFDASTTTGGRPALRYSWDFDGDGRYDVVDATSPRATHTYAQDRTYTARLRVTDAVGRTRETAQTLEMCRKQIAFGIVEATTPGCFAQAGTEAAPRYETTSSVKLNGIPFPAPGGGRRIALTAPTKDLPGGQFSVAGTEIKLGSFTAFRGDINWKLPAGKQGDEKQVGMLTVPGGATLFGMPVGGSIAVKLGFRGDGTHYATFPLNVQLPEMFKSGPNKEAGGISATAAVRIDEKGPHFDGMKLLVQNAWIGKLKVEQVCFSFVPRFSQAVETCPTPELDGRPYITCNEDPATDRWDGNAVIILPTKTETRLAMFGGIANKRLSKLGGFVDNLGTTLPVAQSVYLNRIGVGLCVYPPPFKIRGDVGVSFRPPPTQDAVITVNGYFLYTDAFQNQPWSLELGGNLVVYDTQVGSGNLVIRPTGSIDFGVQAGFGIAGVATIEGRLVGWLETQLRRFNIDGNIRGCLQKLCASLETVLSTTGVGGCLNAGRITYWVLVRLPGWKWWKPWDKVRWEARHVDLKAGFGHRWRTRTVDLFGGSCHLERYRASRSVAHVAQGGHAFDVARATPALAVRVRGTTGPPKLILRGPRGTVIESPEGTELAEPGRFMLVENPSDGTTSILLVNPPAGRWTVEPVADSAIADVATAGFEAPAEIVGTARKRGGKVTLSLAYVLPGGASLSVVERGRQVQRTVARRVRGRPCPGPERPDGARLLCSKLTFRPSEGPGGNRRLMAVVTRAGLPLETSPIARFRAPRWAKPARPKRLRVVRARGGLTVAWAPSRNAATYNVSVRLRDGRRFGLDLAGRCRAARVPGVSRRIGAVVKVAGVRSDLETGAYRKVRLKQRKSRAGAPGAVPKRTCR